jgi:maltose O-acetyltransferase
VKLKYEFQLWMNFILKFIPGNLGCMARGFFLPVKLGNQSKIWENVQIDKPSMLMIGEKSSINRGTVINAGGGVVIGDNVLIGPNVVIYSQNHNYINTDALICEQGYNQKKIIIENDVWIAANAIILPGVRIFQGAVVGAGSVVTKDLARNSINVGVPSKPIGFRR